MYKVNQIGQYDTPTRTNSSRFRVYDKESLSPSLTTMGGGNLEPHILIGSTQKNAGVTEGNYFTDLTSAMGTGGGHVPMHNITPNFRIRKLTPLECWRLMGFTDEEFNKAEKVNSNTQLYKQAGNSIVVDVLEKILYNLLIKNYNEEDMQLDMFALS